MSPFEEMREGQFDTFNSLYVDRPYVLAWSFTLIFIGLVAIRVTRRRMHLE